MNQKKYLQKSENNGECLMRNNDESNLVNVLNELVATHGLICVQEHLDQLQRRHARDEDECELAMVWDSVLFIDRRGIFFETTPDGLQEVPRQYNESGKPFVEMNGWKYWAHVEAYRAFAGDFSSRTHMVQPKDGDWNNCRVSNLMLVKKPWRYGSEVNDAA
jgi:hypothetical protein